ncbi:hypothetical protein H4S06_002915 [Coemansia sp. BCRC 34490]|nr:hypothetical protein H4S06_002915 [Coemansia sp. BCRC 34490]
MNGTALVSDTPSTPPPLDMTLPPDSAPVLAPAPALGPNPPKPLRDIAVLCQVHKNKVKWYMTIDGKHVTIRADTEEEIRSEIKRLVNTGEIETNDWEYTDVEDGVAQRGEEWIKLYEPEFYGQGIKQYCWEDFEIEESNVHLKYCKASVIKLSEIDDEIAFEREVRAYLAAGEHENIAAFQGLLVRNGKVEGMVIKRYEPCGKLDLRDLLGVCAGIQHIHSKGMVHGDLHPGNIVRVPPNNGKNSGSIGMSQTDFTKEQNSATVDNAAKGRVCLIDLGCNGYTEKWSAPEILVGAEQMEDSDVYSIGLLCEAAGYKVGNATHKYVSQRWNLAFLVAHLKMLLQQEGDSHLQKVQE